VDFAVVDLQILPQILLPIVVGYAGHDYREVGRETGDLGTFKNFD
jgi:hypothetical protein